MAFLYCIQKDLLMFWLKNQGSLWRLKKRCNLKMDFKCSKTWIAVHECANRYMLWSNSWTHIKQDTHTVYSGAQQTKPAVVVSGLFDFSDEMSELYSLRHYATDVFECVFAQLCTPVSAIPFTLNQRRNTNITETLNQQLRGGQDQPNQMK